MNVEDTFLYSEFRSTLEIYLAGERIQESLKEMLLLRFEQKLEHRLGYYISHCLARSARLSRAIQCLFIGRNQLDGDFGEIAHSLLRASVENFANMTYILRCLNAHRKTSEFLCYEAKAQILRCIRHADYQLAKLETNSSNILGGLFQPSLSATPEYRRRLTKLHRSAKLYKSLYAPRNGQRFEPFALDLSSRLDAIQKNFANDAVFGTIVSTVRAMMPDLNSHTHGDYHSARFILQGTGEQMRSRRLAMGDTAVFASTMLSLACYRVACELVRADRAYGVAYRREMRVAEINCSNKKA